MQKNYDNWNEQKKKISERNVLISFKERDIFFVNLGKNLGFEQNGTGDLFLRPVLVLKKFNKQTALILPLTRTKKVNKYYFEFKFKTPDKKISKSKVILSQMRLLDTKRFINFKGKISATDFDNLQKIIRETLFTNKNSTSLKVLPPS